MLTTSRTSFAGSRFAMAGCVKAVDQTVLKIHDVVASVIIIWLKIAAQSRGGVTLLIGQQNGHPM